jgi:L-ribulose-5-phosphate 3-epimerase
VQVQGHDVGVCSWSLQPKDMAEMVATVKSIGLSHIQLMLQEVILMDDKRKHAELGHLRNSGLKLTGTMMSFPGEDYATIEKIRQTGGYLPDDTWALRKKMTEEGAKISAELGAKILATHIGFVPHKGQHGYDLMLGRVREIAAICAKHGQQLLLETGQEPAAELRAFLEEMSVPNVGINFDPANMILYGAGEPIEAIRVLGPYIRHVHVKDATGSSKPGVEWGAEVPFETGQVGPKRFLDALHEVGYRGALAIEREAGDQRAADVKTAMEALKRAGSK